MCGHVIISTASERYRDIVIPWYEFGVKRPVTDHVHIEATHDEKSTFVIHESLSSVNGDGHPTVDARGAYHHVDTVLIANGPKTRDLLTPIKINCGNNIERRQY